MRTTKQILSAINAAYAADGGLVSLPDRVCVDCASVLELSGADLSIVDEDGQATIVGASDRDAAALGEFQFELGEGPGVDAWRDGVPVFQPFLTATAAGRWPIFGPTALDSGARAAFAFPLRVGAIGIGTFTMYRDVPGALTGDAAVSALAYADAATVVLLQLQAQSEVVDTLHPDIALAMDHRAAVHQATGFVAVRASIGMSEALLLLRAHAFATEQPLLEVAREVLAGRLRIWQPASEDGVEDMDS